MLTKDLRDVVAFIRRRSEQKRRLVGTTEDLDLAALLDSEAREGMTIADAIESGEYIGASKESVSGNVVTFTIPDVLGAKVSAVREIRCLLGALLVQAKALADSGTVECRDGSQAAELAERLKSAGMLDVQVGASKESA